MRNYSVEGQPNTTSSTGPATTTSSTLESLATSEITPHTGTTAASVTITSSVRELTNVTAQLTTISEIGFNESSTEAGSRLTAAGTGTVFDSLATSEVTLETNGKTTATSATEASFVSNVTNAATELPMTSEGEAGQPTAEAVSMSTRSTSSMTESLATSEITLENNRTTSTAAVIQTSSVNEFTNATTPSLTTDDRGNGESTTAAATGLHSVSTGTVLEALASSASTPETNSTTEPATPSVGEFRNTTTQVSMRNYSVEGQPNTTSSTGPATTTSSTLESLATSEITPHTGTTAASVTITSSVRELTNVTAQLTTISEIGFNESSTEAGSRLTAAGTGTVFDSLATSEVTPETNGKTTATSATEASFVSNVTNAATELPMTSEGEAGPTDS
jgi:hypothetical protein